MIVELYDEAGRMVVRRRVRNRFPATVTVPEGAGAHVMVASAKVKGALVVNGEAVREYTETFDRAMPMTGGDSITLSSPIIT